MFPEWREIQKLKSNLVTKASIETLGTIRYGDHTFPIDSFIFGSSDPAAPALVITGGIHGLERIGTWVATAFLRYLSSRLVWDETLQWQLNRIRIIIIPLVNPVGMMNFSRSNGNGVDLMRNSPIDSNDASFLVGGHHYSNKLPWFRGNPEKTFDGMELESKLLLDHLGKQLTASPRSILLDLHSGFGLQDQIWFPYAKSREKFPELAEVMALKQLLDQALPHHFYRFEPQSKNYMTHGDLWDYFYDLKKAKSDTPPVIIPLTLEMGSWNWVKKNPVQIFTFSGAFNPIKPHRQKRTLRRHLSLFEFLIRALISPEAWKVGSEQRATLEAQAQEELYK